LPISAFRVTNLEMTERSAIEAALDARHADAAAAWASRDLGAYCALFSAGLQYRQTDGQVIDRARLMRDVKAQFDRLDFAESRYTREALVAEGAEATETLLQTILARASAFGILHRSWRIERRGRYDWSIEDGQWKILRVRVLSEEVRGSWRLGR